MKSWNRYLLPAIALIIGLLLGRVTRNSPTTDSAEDETNQRQSRHHRGTNRVSDRPTRDSPLGLTEFQRLRNEVRTAKPDLLPSLVYRALEISDHSERAIAMIEAIRASSPEQCQEIMDQFVKITRESGRLQHDAWVRALFETGKIGGASMLDSWKERGKTGSHTELTSAMYGFATKDPHGALDWFNRPDNADLPNREVLLGHLLGGVALANPAEARRMMNELSIEERRSCIGHMVWNSIQNEGIDSSIEWAIAEQQATESTHPEYAQAIQNDLFDRLFASAEWTGGAPQMAEHIARIHQSLPVSDTRISAAAQRLHGTDGLTLLDQLASKQVISIDESAALSHTIARIAQQSPEASRRWAADHPNSPLQGALHASTQP